MIGPAHTVLKLLREKTRLKEIATECKAWPVAAVMMTMMMMMMMLMMMMRMMMMMMT